MQALLWGQCQSRVAFSTASPPYTPRSSQVQIVEFKERPGAKDLVCAELLVERESQVGIVVGRSGAALKKLGQEARKDIEEFLGRPVFLELSVQVAKDWREDKDALNKFGYFDQLYS